MQREHVGGAAIRQLVARIFPLSPPPVIERAEEGVSTLVYRIRRDDEVFYLRLLPEEGASFAPEVRVHQLLRERNVKVPEIVHFEHYNAALRRSVMVTTEVSGAPIGHRPLGERLRQILVEAGRDLAIVNSILVEGFGWIARDGAGAGRLTAEHPTYRAAFLEGFAEDLAALGAGVLEREEVAAIRAIVARRDSRLDVARGSLAHGDFDATHIYQRDGRYSGIIDFGEIRGGDPYYDLGHFLLHDGERLPVRVLPHLLAGYREAAPLPPDHQQRIRLSGLTIGVRALARSAGHPPGMYQRYLAGSVRRLIAESGG